MIIVGVNAFHGDSSACLVRDGKLIAAAEEERFTRIKHWAGFPALAIRYCLREAGIGLSDVRHVAINQDSGANFWRKAAFAIAHRPRPTLVLSRLRNRGGRASIDKRLEQALPGQAFSGKVHHIEHHLAHLASAYYVSPFREAVALSVDGFGDFASAGWGLGRDNALSVDQRVFFPHSLGIFYQAMTQHLGFPHYGDEYKVMGLAPYGEPKYLDRMRKIVRVRKNGEFELDLSYFRHHREKIDYRWDNGAPSVGYLCATKLESLLGPARKPEEPIIQHHRDLARSTQAMYEETFFHLLDHLHRTYRINDLALAGGCAMNSVANGKVYRMSPFKRLYVQSAAGDAGGAIGAAYAAWNRISLDSGHSFPRFHMDHAYFGPAFSDEEIRALLESKKSELEATQCSLEHIAEEENLCALTARAIRDGRVVGWFQGRMEWGPRALGNRSIVCDPRRADMKDILNSKIKRRESFRPFAPSILRDAVREWFETDDDVPFMMQVYQVREEKRRLIPAVTHVDGSGRLQTVYRDTNPRYYRLIEAFNSMTGVPVVLNTSFNENEPVVCRPEEALDCFLRTKMDVLVLGDFVVRRVGDLS
jgi:carbamoyltransferase